MLLLRGVFKEREIPNLSYGFPMVLQQNRSISSFQLGSGIGSKIPADGEQTSGDHQLIWEKKSNDLQ